MRALPEQSILRDLLDYDPETGLLTWRTRTEDHFPEGERFGSDDRMRMWNGRFSGKPAFSHRSTNGYLQGVLLGVGYRAHRIIWKLVHGAEPDTIDHINGDPADNRLCNLRSVSMADNLKNQCRPKTNTSGVAGVRYDKRLNRWRAKIGDHYLGIFRTQHEAVAAREVEATRLGFHPNHGRDHIGHRPATSVENISLDALVRMAGKD
jgi:hypothetical protein